MKWPASLMLVRHDISAYNVLKVKKAKDPLYGEFLRAFESEPLSHTCKTLARKVRNSHALNVSDVNTPLDPETEGLRAKAVGGCLAKNYPLPDIIFVSPYVRARETLRFMTQGWPELVVVRVVEEERIREQEHGLATLYNDWRVFHSLNEEQYALYNMEGRYWYRYPQGENVPDVRDRNRSFLTTLTRDFAEKRVLVITHHLNILAMRANLERLGEKQFIELDENEKPVNCGVTHYVGAPEEGEEGRLKLGFYNQQMYSEGFPI